MAAPVLYCNWRHGGYLICLEIIAAIMIILLVLTTFWKRKKKGNAAGTKPRKGEGRREEEEEGCSVCVCLCTPTSAACGQAWGWQRDTGEGAWWTHMLHTYTVGASLPLTSKQSRTSNMNCCSEFSQVLPSECSRTGGGAEEPRPICCLCFEVTQPQGS